MPRNRLHWLLAGLILLMTAGFIAFRSIPLIAQTDSLLLKIERAAAQGDPLAQDYIERLDGYLADEEGAAIPQQEEIGEVVSVGGATVAVNGLTPFYIKLYNQTPLATDDQIDEYIQTRSQTLKQLVERNSDAQLEVSVSFRDYTDLDALWQMKRQFEMDVDDMTVHLFLDGERYSVTYMADPKEPDDVAYIDFETSVEEFKEQLKDLMPSASFAEDGIAAALSPSDFNFKVDWLRASLPADIALEVNAQDSVMLVDPVTDLREQYESRVLDVFVVDVPNLHAARQQAAIEVPAQPVEANPTPDPTKE